MKEYFQKCGDTFRGWPVTSLPVCHVKPKVNEQITLKTAEDLNLFRELANNRERWRDLRQNFVETAEVSMPFDEDAKGS